MMLLLAATENTELKVAVLSSFTAICIALIGFVGLYLQARSHGRVLDKTYGQINGIAENEAVPGEATLGQTVRDGFKRNDEVHRLLSASVQEVSDTVHTNTGRIDQHRRELNDLDERVGDLESTERNPGATSVPPDEKE